MTTNSSEMQMEFPLFDVMTRAQVAEILRVHQSTLSRWARLGYGPPCRYLAPNVPRYLRTDVEEYLKGLS